MKSIGKLKEIKTYKRIDSCFLDDVKIDIVSYPYEWIDSPLIEDNLRLASKKEIAAMKIAAIVNRGTKKDFIVLNELLNFFNLKEIIDFYISKFNDSSVFFALKSVLYFEDAETEKMPYMFNNITWQTNGKRQYQKGPCKYMTGMNYPVSSVSKNSVIGLVWSTLILSICS